MDTLQHIALLIGAIFAYAWFVQHNDARRNKLKAEGWDDWEIERLLSKWWWRESIALLYAFPVGVFATLSLISEGLTWLAKPESRTFALIALILFFTMPFIAIGILVAVGFLYRKRNREKE